MFSLIIFFFLLFAFVPIAQGENLPDITISGLQAISEEELLYLLGIEPEKTIDAETIREGIKRAFLKGIFEDIAVNVNDEEHPRILISVKERRHINSINTEGDYEVSNKTIKKYFALQEEGIILCDSLEKAVNGLIQQLKTNGFPLATAEASIENTDVPNKVNIRLGVITGEPEIIQKIVLLHAGDDAFSEMKLREGSIYDQVAVDRDIGRIVSYYKKKGYFNPVVGPYTFTNGTLTIPVNPGKRLEISFEGNDSISTKTLAKEIPFFEAEDFNDAIVEESVQRLLFVYHAKGYHLAQIAPVATSQDDLIQVHFYVYEGPEIQVRTISFSGSSLPEKSLKEIMILKEGKAYNSDRIEADRETLEAFYNSLGFLSVHIDEFEALYDKESQKVDILVRIQEGVRTEIESINIIGTKQIPEAKVREVIMIREGDPYNDIDISDAKLRVIELYSNSGFPEAWISVRQDFQGDKATIKFIINEGTEIHFGKTIIIGNQKTRYEVIRRELQQREGMKFDYSILTGDRQRLYKLGIFTDVNIEILDIYDHKKDILLSLTEGKAGSIEFGLGYSDYERFRGFVDVKYSNLWGMNREALVRLEMSSLEKRYILQYQEPWFFNRRLPFKAFLLGEDRREVTSDNRETLYRLKRHTATAGIEKKLSDLIKAEVFYEFSVVNTSNVKPDVVLSKEDTGTLIISGLRLGLLYDTRDNPFYPAAGMLAGLSVKATSPLFLSETDFIKLSFFNNHYYELISKWLLLGVSLRGGVAQGYNDTKELPIVERFFLGGGTTVRGYEQDTLGPKGSDGNPTGGNVFLMENIEFRTSVTKDLGLVTFLDGGNVWIEINDFTLKDLKFTTGLGLRYNTPVGPLRIDYGYKLSREEGESRGALHFSIGHAF